MNPSTVTHIDTLTTDWMQHHGVPGISLALTDRSQDRFVRAYGMADIGSQTPLTTDHLLEIGSIGKSMTAVLLLQLQEEGLLDLLAPVSRYLPWFYVHGQLAPITLHHLLSHSAGIISGSDSAADPRYEVWALRDSTVYAEPGALFHYSNVGYVALGLVLEAITGQPYGSLLQERLLTPVGMNQTQPTTLNRHRPHMATGYMPMYDDRPFLPGDPLAPATWLEYGAADGSVVSTPRDMLALVRLWLNRGRVAETQLLSTSSFEQMIAPRIQTGEPDSYYGYGLNRFQKDGYLHIGHTGGMVGYFAATAADLDNGLGVFLACNAPADVNGLALPLLQILRAEEGIGDMPVIKFRSPVPIKGADDFAGVFQGGKGELLLRADGVKLLMDEFPLHQRGVDSFFLPHPAFNRFLIHFERDKTGKITGFSHGPDWYGRPGMPVDGPTTPVPSNWQQVTGHYRSFTPWTSNFRVILRRERVYLVYANGQEEPLTPLSPRTFRLGDDARLPETISFDTILNGQAQRAFLSGGTYYRVFTP